MDADHPELDDPSIVVDRPHVARMYDYLLGGRTNYPVDRDAANAAEQQWPTVRIGLRSNRAFMHRAVRLLAQQGIDQFLDIGTGIPTSPNLHEIVQAVNPAARVVYVDNDPIVRAHAQALLTGTSEGCTTYIHGDARHPSTIFTNAALALLDFSRPVAVSTVALLHFLNTDEAHQLIGAALDRMSPGSALVLSHASRDPDNPADPITSASDTYRSAGMDNWVRTPAEIVDLIPDRLTLWEPGLTYVHRWRPDEPKMTRVADSDVKLMGAVAVLS